MTLSDVAQERAARFLEAADVFYLNRDQLHLDPDEDITPFELNLNDTFWWGTSYSIVVKTDELVEVARLFHTYGRQGIYYWAAKRDNITPEFLDVRRGIQFVRAEEDMRERVPKSSRRAYSPTTYTIGGTWDDFT